MFIEFNIQDMRSSKIKIKIFFIKRVCLKLSRTFGTLRSFFEQANFRIKKIFLKEISKFQKIFYLQLVQNLLSYKTYVKIFLYDSIKKNYGTLF